MLYMPKLKKKNTEYRTITLNTEKILNTKHWTQNIKIEHYGYHLSASSKA